jgi:hypothetical protein
MLVDRAVRRVHRVRPEVLPPIDMNGDHGSAVRSLISMF